MILFWYPDPDQRFLIRIRIRPNDTDPTRSGSETLKNIVSCNPTIVIFRDSGSDSIGDPQNNVDDKVLQRSIN